MFANFKKNVLLLLLCGLLCSCQEVDIAHDLTQRQANEIVSVLSEQGIRARAIRATGSRSQFFIEVPSSSYTEAVAILHHEGLPKQAEPGVTELLAPKGFLPNSRELESMRIDRAIAAELESMLRTNPAINDVKAVVRRSAFDGVGPQAPAHVSISIRKNPGFEIQQEALLSLTVNMIPGVVPESFVVDIQESAPLINKSRQGVLRDGDSGKLISMPMKEFLGWWRVAENDYDKMVLVLLGAVLFFMAVGLVVGFSAGFIGRKVVSSRTNESTASLRIDRSTLSLGSPE